MKRSAMPSVLLLFVDGLGLGDRDPSINPIFRGHCPVLAALLDGAKPIDAGLGVPGSPQSATGQATIFTGVNAARHMGRHVEGIPGPTLRALVEARNIYDQLAAVGVASTFANAYWVDSVEQVRAMRRRSVSTTAALKAFGEVRKRVDLLADRAVYQDLTREAILQRGFEVPLVEPEAAAEHLMRLAEEFGFTLFEYFQTDLMAHRGTAEDVARVLGLLDRFVGRLCKDWPAADRMLLLVSDHGNIEDSRTRAHTANPVPWLALGGDGEARSGEVSGLTDVCPFILQTFTRSVP